LLSVPYFFSLYSPLKDARKRGPEVGSHKKPQDRNDHSQWQTRGRHENVKAEYVEDDGTQNRKSQWHVAIRKQEDRGRNLQKKNHHVKPGHEERTEELRCCSASRGRQGNKVKEAVESERQKDQTEQVPCDCRSDLHAYLLVTGAMRARPFDILMHSISISIHCVDNELKKALNIRVLWRRDAQTLCIVGSYGGKQTRQFATI
jgi:hypothetical protein